MSGTSIHINEILCYCSFYINNSSINNIKRIVANFYSDEDINIAKKTLWDIAGEQLGNYIERKTSEKRTSGDANITDIFEALSKLDYMDKMPNFVAKNVDLLPDRQPEELNLISIIDRLHQVEDKQSKIDNIMISADNNSTVLSEKINNMVKNHDNLIDVITKKEADIAIMQKSLDIMKTQIDSLQDSLNKRCSEDNKKVEISDKELVERFQRLRFINEDSSCNLLGMSSESVNKKKREYSSCGAFSIDKCKPLDVIDYGKTTLPVYAVVPDNDVVPDNTDVPDNIVVPDNTDVPDKIIVPDKIVVPDITTVHVVPDHSKNLVTYNLDEGPVSSSRSILTLNPDSGNNNLSDSEDNMSMSEGKIEEFLDCFKVEDDKTTSYSDFILRKKNMDNKESSMIMLADKYSDKIKINNLNPNCNNFLNKELTKKLPLIDVVDNSLSGQTKLIDDEGFELAESRSNMKKRLKNMKLKNIKLVGAPPPLIDIWIYKVLEGNVFTIKEYIEDNGIKVEGVTKTSNIDAKYKSFKATIFKTDIKKILNKKFWPMGIGVKLWIRRKEDKGRQFINSRISDSKRRY